MLNKLVTAWFRHWGGPPCFRIHGKTRREANWRVIDVFASRRHDLVSRWPLLAGACVTWSDQVIVVGRDFAENVLKEQIHAPASRQNPIEVAGGRLRGLDLRHAAGASSFPTCSEILAHEIGHTGQALRLGAVYLPLVGSQTLFREGRHWWNHFENQASEHGQFGGIVNGSVGREFMEILGNS